MVVYGTGKGARVASADTFDILVATDCRFPGGSTASVVDEIRTQARAGYRTALLHVPSLLIGPHRSFAPALRRTVEDGMVTLVTGLSEVTAKLLLVRQPSVFAETPVGLPKILVDHALIVANVLPDGPGRYEQAYDVDRVARQVERAARVTPTWAPISPVVRDALTSLSARHQMLPWDWEPVIDVAQWRAERSGFRSDRPVLGRHTADHWAKWPGRRRELLSAYPDDPRYEIRVLGGMATPTAVLGYQPANWTGFPFSTVSPQRFLAGLDFFVYFHHRNFTEPFGRAVLEALASGAVAILPRALEPIFGDACRYGQPSDVRQHVGELYADWDAYAALSRAGVELAAKRFAPETHLERLASLIGSPAEPPSDMAPAVRPRGTLVVDLTRGDTLDSVVSSTVRATVAARGPRIVALPAARAAGLTARVAVETFPRALEDMATEDRRHYLRTRLASIVRAHAPARVIVVDDGHGDARELFTELDGVAALWLIQPGGSSAEIDDDVAAEVVSILPRGWSMAALPPGRAAAIALPATPVETDALARTRRRLLLWARAFNTAMRRRLLSWLRADAQQAGLMLVELDGAGHMLPVRASAGQEQGQRLPVALVVVTDQYSDPSDGVRAIVERQLVAGTFRTALLAPPEWEPAAVSAGLTVETFIPEPAWALLYGSGWSPYFRQRVYEACQAVAASTVVFAENVVPEHAAAAALDVLEASRIRPPAGP